MHRSSRFTGAMAKKSLNGVVHHIRKLAAVQTERDLGDSELLERFVRAKDEGAFTVLVERHGPMVWGVCNRVLRNRHDADDGCQAVFLVLARKAGSIRKKASLSSWLHGVAGRVAADLKRQQARRQRRETNAGVRETDDSSEELTWREAQTILDEELQQLPERYRTPLILCYLEGKTRDEAAEQLGLSAGALHGRLERGRVQLRKRMVQRGFTLSAALFASALGEGVGRAALSPTLVVSSTKAAAALASGQTLSAAIAAPRVVSLTEGVIKTMFLTKAKIGTAIVLCALVLGGIVAGSAASTAGAQQKCATIEYRVVIDKADSKESDEQFIRRISKDLRGREPTPAEVHFFVNSKHPGRRQKLVDLFIRERQTQAAKERDKRLAARLDEIRLLQVVVPERPAKMASDEVFLRRVYLDLTGKLPAAGEVQKFLSDRDPHKRRKLIHRLLASPQGIKRAGEFIEKSLGKPGPIKESRTKRATGKTQTAQPSYRLHIERGLLWLQTQSDRFSAIQGDFYKSILAAGNKKDAAAITRNYLDRLVKYVKDRPKNNDVSDAMLHIVLVYRSLGKSVEADAWRGKLLKEHPTSDAAKTASQEVWERAAYLFIDRSQSMNEKQKALKK